MTTNNTTSEANIQRLLKDLERIFCFTDVPCGAMEYQDISKKSSGGAATKQETSTGLLQRLESMICFSDLKDLEKAGQLTKKVCGT